jgi:ABC-type histidine transport system ATPase subunit
MGITDKPDQTVALEVKDLHKSFGPLEVLSGVSLTAHEGDVISIIGSSGSGKSTLLRCWRPLIASRSTGCALNWAWFFRALISGFI